MTANSVQVFDEFGSRWKVSGGDPAAKTVNRLVRMNYRLVLLPFVTLATGRVVPPAQRPTDIIHDTRLYDCLAALGV